MKIIFFSHVLTANEPADWCLFFSLVLAAAAAAAFWVLFCCYVFCGFRPWNALQKINFSSNTERGKLVLIRLQEEFHTKIVTTVN